VTGRIEPCVESNTRSALGAPLNARSVLQERDSVQSVPRSVCDLVDTAIALNLSLERVATCRSAGLPPATSTKKEPNNINDTRSQAFRPQMI
jgi:hypothetical protein